jgi:hypothetical protein
MSQQAGRKVPQVGVPQQDYIFTTVEPSDAVGNAAAHAMIFGNPLGSKTVIAGNFTYIGECGRPGATVADPVWRITRQETLAGGAEIKHAFIPAAGNVPAKYAGFDHAFADYAAITNWAY